MIAIGVLIPFAWLDRTFDQLVSNYFGFGTGLLFTGTIFAILFAYVARFSSISVGGLEAGYGKIRPSIDDAAQTMGSSPGGIFKKIHFPMLKGSILIAALIVFVDVMKELPATALMRPFNFDTLAVQAHNFAADERLAEAAVASLIIAAVGLIPVYVINRNLIRTQRGKDHV